MVKIKMNNWSLRALPSMSLRTKVISLVCITVFVSTASIGAFFHNRTINNTLETAVESLTGETHLLALRFKDAYGQMESDLFMASNAPSIQAITTQQNLDQSSPEGLSLTQEQKDRLADLFASLMVVRPQYTQIRFIGLPDNGRELVRTNRTPEGIVQASAQGLQQKGEEPYFQAVAAHMMLGHLNEIKSGHAITFSDVTYNRENGKVVIPKVATIRAILPVYTVGHKLFGMLVLNADYEKLLSQAFEDIIQDNSVYVINNAGDYLEYKAGGKISNLEFHDHYTVLPPSAVNLAQTETATEKSIIGDAHISYFVRVGVSDEAPDAAITVMVQSSRAKLLTGANIIRRDSIYLTGLFLALSILLAYSASRMITEPLRELTEKIIYSTDGAAPLNLPTTAKGEIGKLAKAFQALTDSHVASENKLRSIISNIGEGIIIIDEVGEIEGFNPACTRIFGYSEDEALGQNVKLLMEAKTAEAHADFLKRYTSSNDRKIDWVGREEIGRRKSGETFSIELTVTELYLEDRRVFVGIVRDITERQIAEKAKTEFIAVVSHELRTPLTSIKGALSLMASGAIGPLSEGLQKTVNIALRNSDRLARLINDILDIEKITNGSMIINHVPVDLALLVQESIEANKTYAMDRGVQLKCRGVDAPVIMMGDANRLMQVLTNLISNGAKFSKTGGAVVVDLSKLDDGKIARISVIDDGIGIPEHALATIFDKFTQVDPSNEHSKEGSGLGLGIAKKLVELHDGKINIKTKEDVGTTVYVDFSTVD
jgi:PAS domain S-box-containing protein